MLRKRLVGMLLGTRLPRLLPVGALGIVVLHFGAREAVASAVAFAPNATRAADEAVPLPAELADRSVTRLKVPVGPPKATLAAWVVEPKARAARGTIVLLHGIRLDKRSLVSPALAFSDAGYRTVLVDLRGHGESSGRYLTYGAVENRNVSSVLDALEASGTKLGCVGAYGYSYGAAVALELGAHDARVRAVVAVAPFSSLRSVILDYRRRYLPAPLSAIPDSWFQGAVNEASRIAAFDPDGSAPERAATWSTAEQLLIHGTSDTQVPLAHSERLARAAQGRARLVTVAGASHDTIPAFAETRRESLAWFERWLEPEHCEKAQAPADRH